MGVHFDPYFTFVNCLTDLLGNSADVDVSFDKSDNGHKQVIIHDNYGYCTYIVTFDDCGWSVFIEEWVGRSSMYTCDNFYEAAKYVAKRCS